MIVLLKQLDLNPDDLPFSFFELLRFGFRDSFTNYNSDAFYRISQVDGTPVFFH
jgi:hypothetical protein